MTHIYMPTKHVRESSVALLDLKTTLAALFPGCILYLSVSNQVMVNYSINMILASV